MGTEHSKHPNAMQSSSQSSQASTLCNAKINLGLHVLERLETGFHRIETGYCFIEWADRLSADVSQKVGLELSGPVANEEIPTDERNLVLKAYRAFEKKVGLKRHYHFRLEKEIPSGAGLGGGSSNAAATLRILNELEQAALSTQDLIEISRPIGSDIALFLAGQPGLATGQGVDIELLEVQPEGWIVTVWPGFESSTAEAYQACVPEPNPVLPLRTILTEEPLEEWPILLTNDLEPAVVARFDMVGLMKEQLYEFGADYASMSGSGSSVFGIFEQDFVALHAYESIQNLGYLANLTRPSFIPDLRILTD